jgi:hypothetical protein
MNTFLPFQNFYTSAACLDKRRCFKQVVETYQILNVLDGKSTGWKNHPAVRIWVGYRDCLQYYYNTFYYYCETKHNIQFKKLPKPVLLQKLMIYPPWLGYLRFHEIMRQNLIRKGLDDADNGRNELLDKLKSNNITPDNTLSTTGYMWPVNKDGSLLPEISLWLNNQKRTIINHA